MIHHHFGKTILLGCVLLACAGFATADIGQCNKDGKPVYKNVRCNNAVKIERPSASKKHTSIRAKVSSTNTTVAASSKAHQAAWKKKATSERRFPLDVATAKAARTSMLLIEESWSYLREQKLAALE